MNIKEIIRDGVRYILTYEKDAVPTLADVYIQPLSKQKSIEELKKEANKIINKFFPKGKAKRRNT